jgi:hypothetical protein
MSVPPENQRRAVGIIGGGDIPVLFIQAISYIDDKYTATQKAGIAPCPFYLFRLGEIILAYSAEGALEIIGQILKLCTGGDAVIGVADCLVLFPAAYFTYIFLHSFISFLSFRAFSAVKLYANVIITYYS